MMSEHPNPYAAPESSPDASDVARRDEQQVISHWERLRLYYNGILAAVVLAVTLLKASLFLEQAYWFNAILAALAANVCFCIGPVLEHYLAMFGADRRLLRIVLFLLGTVFSVLVTLAATLTILTE